MKVIEGLKYTKEHEWIKMEGSKAYIGITDHAQDHLGEIVYVELPEIGKKLGTGDTLGVVESIKAASDIYTAVAGEVVEVNDALADTPEKLNEAPYENWIAVLETDGALPDDLMDAAAYEEFCAGEEE